MHLKSGLGRRLTRRSGVLTNRRINHLAPGPDPWSRVRFGAGVLGLILTVGVIGYRLLGLGMFDAIYQTGITVTTVGFDEIGPKDEIDRGYRVFTLVLVFFGTGGVLYTLGMIVEAFLEGSLTDGRRRRKEQQMIDEMSDHIIVAGAGRVGLAITAYAQRHRAGVVVIDREFTDDIGVPMVVGEATDDDVLHRAGIERARTLVAALNTDADNIYVTITARALNPDLFIVARTTRQADEPKFRRAGANRMVNPHQIGGARMGRIALHPNVAGFIEDILHDELHDVTMKDLTMPADSPVVGMTAGELLASLRTHPMLVAIRDPLLHYLPNPPSETPLQAGHVLIILGSPEDYAEISATVLR